MTEYHGRQIGNELAFYEIYIQGGFILATLYLAILLKYTRFYRVFILVSLLHYGYVMSPLIVYMLVTYSREIQLLRISDVRKSKWKFKLLPARVPCAATVLKPK